MADEKPKGYLAKYGERLIAAGYKIIPIVRGSKRPPFDGWEKANSTPKLLRSWVEGDYSRAGLGILTKKTPAVDIDILDEAASEHMMAWVEENIGRAPVRVGMAPKRLMMFRTDEPFPKINSKTYEDEWGDETLSHSGSGKPTGHLRKVEILGDGQQFVAYAVHPDTGEPYRWVKSGDPLTFDANELPLLSYDQAQDIVAEFERYAEERGWTEHKQSRSVSRLATKPGGKVDHEDVFAADKAKTDISDEDLRRKLLLAPGAEDYDTWFQVGMALWHQYDGEELGLQLWHEWSSEADNYDPDALDSKWETFDGRDKARTPVTARLIIKLADEATKEIAVETFREIKEELNQCNSLDRLREVCLKVKHIEFDVFARTQIVGIVKDRFKALTGHLLQLSIARDMVRYENPKPKDLPRWLEGWTYMTVDKGFYSQSRRTFMATESFNAAFGRFMLTKKEVLEGKSVPETSASQFALNNKQIPVVQTRMYLPGEDELFHYNSEPFVNSYNPTNIPDVPTKLTGAERAAIETVKGHFGHLFENEVDRAVLLDAIAYLVQNPGKRLNWAVLLQGTEADGKTFFAGLLAAVLGPENINNLAAGALEEKFNGWAEGVQVVFFEEIKLHGHNRFDVLNKIKPLLTNRMVPVRRMNVDTYSAVNTVTYFLTTNFKDALPLDDNDSRYFVLFSRFQNKAALHAFLETDPEYYQRLYDTLEHGGALRKWLLNHKINPTFSGEKRAPMSEAKAEMVMYAKSEETETLEELLANSMRMDVTPELLNVSTVAEYFSNAGVDVPYGRTMSKLLMEQGYTKLGRVRLGDDTPWFWSKTPRKFTGRDGKVDPNLVKNWLSSDL